MATEGEREREREREREGDSEQHGKVLSISWPGDCGVLHISCVARVPGWQLQGGDGGGNLAAMLNLVPHIDVWGFCF